ncbi:MAG: Tol-Pal system beta propeller repeat protein TolB [Pseudomonadota bacterium]
MKHKLSKRLTIIPTYLIFMVSFIFAGSLHAGLVIDITEGVEGALPIAVSPFLMPDNAVVKKTGQGLTDIASVIRNDLRRSGLFSPLSVNQLPASPTIKSTINFQRWKGSGTENLVVGDIKRMGKNHYEVSFKMYDIYTKQQILSSRFNATKAKLRRVAHKISDLIYEKLTGVKGDFDTLLCYIVARGSKNKSYTLMVSDSDGFNEQTILRSKHPLMSPSWSPNGKRLAYVSFEKRRSIVYVQELKTGKRKIVASYKGINSSPRWSPDGKRIAVALSKDGNAEIYIIYVNSGVTQRITRHYGIDTEPQWTPDGKKLIFTSDRGGKVQLYEINVGSKGRAGNPRRLTFEGKYNARGSYSPDGESITYITRENGAYRVAIMTLANASIAVLTQSKLDESPSFSPNGKSIIYATQLRGKGVLQIVPVDGGVSPQRLRVNSGDVREPSWSGFRIKY